MILNNISVSELNTDDWVALSVKYKGVLKTLLGKVVYCTSPFDTDEISASVELTNGMTISINDKTNFRKIEKPYDKKLVMDNDVDKTKNKKIIKVNHSKYLKSIKKELFGHSIQLTENVNECQVFNFNKDVDLAVEISGGKKIDLINVRDSRE